MDYEDKIKNIVFWLKKGKPDIASDIFLDLFKENKQKLKSSILQNEFLIELVIFNIKQLDLNDILPIEYKNNEKLFQALLVNRDLDYSELNWFNEDIILKNKENMLKEICSWHQINSFSVLYKDMDFMEKLFKKDNYFNISYFDKSTVKKLPFEVVKFILEKCPGIEKHRIEFFTSLPEILKKDIHIQKEFLNKLSDDTDLFNEFKSIYVDIKFPCLAKNLKEIVKKPIEERKSLEDNIHKTEKTKKTKI